MGFQEKSAWATAWALIPGYGWYVATVAGRPDDGSISGLDYQVDAVIAAIAVAVLIAAAHVVLAGRSRPESKPRGIVRRANPRGVILAATAVLGMTLAMVEAEYFWIANVAIAGLVLSELAAAVTHVISSRKEA